MFSVDLEKIQYNSRDFIQSKYHRKKLVCGQLPLSQQNAPSYSKYSSDIFFKLSKKSHLLNLNMERCDRKYICQNFIDSMSSSCYGLHSKSNVSFRRKLKFFFLYGNWELVPLKLRDLEDNEAKRRLKISLKNKGRSVWNKGIPHSAGNLFINVIFNLIIVKILL